MNQQDRNKARQFIGVTLSIFAELAGLVWRSLLTAKRKVVHFLHFDNQQYRKEKEELAKQRQLKLAVKRLGKRTERQLVKSEVEKRKTRWGSPCR